MYAAEHLNSSLFIAREALAQKQPGSGITKAVVRPSGDTVGLGTSWHDAPLLLLLSSQASEQVATSTSEAGGAQLALGALCQVYVSTST